MGRDDKFPDCTPERERNLISEIEENARKAAHEMRKANDTPSRSLWSEKRKNAMDKLAELRRVCGRIAVRGKAYRNEEQAYDDLFAFYKNRFDREEGDAEPDID